MVIKSQSNQLIVITTMPKFSAKYLVVLEAPSPYHVT